MNDDQKLLDGIAARDPEAFRTLVDSYAPFLIRVAARFCGTVADAEDVAQEVLIRLYQHPPRLAPNTKLSAWLYRVTVNRCRDLLKKKAHAGKSVSLGTPLLEVSSDFTLRLWRRLMKEPYPRKSLLPVPVMGAAVAIGVLMGIMSWRGTLQSERWDLFGNAPLDSIAGSYLMLMEGRG